ncbi:hypothetical protein CRG98_005305 [Punica granatum]|uniref:Reverse transcriptase RNase H-like domain-containing protein n=1 Tax=Punica granatum TaxID=22663 RepID=A0A2I0L0R9_PUNGR|nr:hypothetical protein CRG98_005305 [Punica granatum]
MDELRRQVQQLQQQLERLQAGNSDESRHGSDVGEVGEDYGVKVDIPDFEGQMHPEDFIDWLATVERVFDFKNIFEEKKVKLVAIKLKKHASVWWENLKRRREREGKRRIVTYEKMKWELKKKFLPARYKQDIFSLLYNFKQEELTVEEYTAEFEHLMMKMFASWLFMWRSNLRRRVLIRPWDETGSLTGGVLRLRSHHRLECVKIILAPCRMEDKSKAVMGGGSSYLSKSQFLQVMDRSLEAYALVPSEENEEREDISPVVKSLLEEFRDVVPDEILSGLPPMRDIQHHIDLVPGAAIPSKAVYQMSPKEHKELQRQVDELLHKGLIRESLSPCAVPALLVPKKDGSWRMCIDSRAVNKITINTSVEEHLEHLRELFKVLREQRLYANLKKCHFLTNSVNFLGYIVSQEGIRMDPSKVEGIVNWSTPRSLQEVRSFHGLASFYRSEKLNGPRRNYSTYDKEFYVIVRALANWRHYLISKEFVLFSDHEALKYINGQHKLNNRHAKWVEFLQAYTFVIKHKSGTQNQVANALSWRCGLLSSMQVKVSGIEIIKELYEEDVDFSKTWRECSKGPWKDFLVHDGYLFKSNKLCIPQYSLREAIIKEAHEGGLGGKLDSTGKLRKSSFQNIKRFINRSFLEEVMLNLLEGARAESEMKCVEGSKLSYCLWLLDCTSSYYDQAAYRGCTY